MSGVVVAWRATATKGFIRFLNWIEAVVPAGKLIYTILVFQSTDRTRLWAGRSR